jgi:prepilin-type N-terminal cleavage/methylation domain-containing protein
MKSRAAYTLLEVLVAAAIISIAVAAAGALALATVAQEEMNARVARCLNLHEQAVRLYQLGLEPDQIADLLPPDPSVVSLDIPSDEVTVPGDLPLTVEQADSTLTFTTSDTSEATRTSQITVIRPAIR